jgi:hypothetical protein
MQSILYTDTDKLRSMLGVSDKDISDSQITDRGLDKELQFDLLSWVPTHSVKYRDGRLPNSTPEQKALADAISLYSTYFCSSLMVKSLQLATPQSISDGKNALSRFTSMDWNGVYAHLTERAAFYKTFVQETLTATASSVVYKPFSGVSLSVDPVVSGDAPG